MLIGTICGLWLAIAAGDEPNPLEQWPQFRGPLGTGEAPQADPPVSWSEDSGVLWKTELPGLGHSSPVVWGDRVFVTSAVPFGPSFPALPDKAPGAHDNLGVTQRHEFVVLGLDRESGEVAWSQTASCLRPHEGGHATGSLASASPVVDADRVIAFFGSHGLYCYDHDGSPLWERDLGQMNTKHAHGEGASPALHGDTVVVNWDHEDQSFVVALDAATGEERWRGDRDEVTSWATPLIVEHEGAAQVIVAGTNRLRSYDLATGDVLWQCGGLSHNIVASPVSADGIVYSGSSYEKKAMLAIRLDGASGELSESDQLLWFRRRRTPYVPSPLLYRGALYYLGHYQGVLTRLEAKTGQEPSGPFRLGGIRDLYASPVAAAGRLYFVGRGGGAVVLEAGLNPRPLAVNQLDDRFSATPALSRSDLFLRGERFLYCLRAQ